MEIDVVLIPAKIRQKMDMVAGDHKHTLILVSICGEQLELWLKEETVIGVFDILRGIDDGK